MSKKCFVLACQMHAKFGSSRSQDILSKGLGRTYCTWDATAQGVWFANTELVGHFILYCYSTIKYPTENDYSLEVFNGDDVGSELLDSLPVDGLIKGARVDSVGECETRDGVELEVVVAGVGCDSVLSVGCRFILQRSAESQQSVV